MLVTFLSVALAPEPFALPAAEARADWEAALVLAAGLAQRLPPSAASPAPTAAPAAPRPVGRVPEARADVEAALAIDDGVVRRSELRQLAETWATLGTP